MSTLEINHLCALSEKSHRRWSARSIKRSGKNGRLKNLVGPKNWKARTTNRFAFAATRRLRVYAPSQRPTGWTAWLQNGASKVNRVWTWCSTLISSYSPRLDWMCPPPQWRVPIRTSPEHGLGKSRGVLTFHVGFCKVSRIHIAKENCGFFLGKASAQKVFPAICIPGVKRPDAV